MIDHSTSTPFVDDEENENPDEALFKVGAYAPDGDGSKGQGRTPMPTPQDSTTSNQNGRSSPGGVGTAKTRGSDDPDEAVLAPGAVSAPTIDRSRFTADNQRLQADAKPLDRNAPGVKVTWKDRLLGGLAGGLSLNPEAGMAVTNRRYNAAEKDRQGRMQADQTALEGDRQDIADQGQQWERGLQAHNAQASDYNSARTRLGERARSAQEQAYHEQQQGNWQQEFGRLTGNDQFEHSRATQNDEATRQQETERNRQEKERLGYEGRRTTAEEANVNSEITERSNRVPGQGTAAAELRRGQDADKLLTERRSAYQAVTLGDNKTGTPGYAQQLRELQTSQENPDTGRKWGPGERDAAISRLKAEHVQALNQIEAQYVNGMQNIGYNNVRPVQYDENGQAQTDSSGKPLGRGAPPPQAPPQAPQQAAGRAQGDESWMNQPTGMQGIPTPNAPVRPQAPPQAAPQQAPPQQQPQAVRPPGIARGNGQTITDRSTLMKYLQAAGGDPAKAAALAKADGWVVPASQRRR